MFLLASQTLLKEPELHNWMVIVNEETVIRVVGKALDVDTSSLSADSEIGSVPEWDSLGHLTIVRLLQEEFAVELSIDDVIECESVQDFVDVISGMSTLP